jgi:hypothetical protein
MLAEFGIPQRQREKLIDEARARLQWAAASGEISAASAVRNFAETILSILNVDADATGAGQFGAPV